MRVSCVRPTATGTDHNLANRSVRSSSFLRVLVGLFKPYQAPVPLPLFELKLESTPTFRSQDLKTKLKPSTDLADCRKEIRSLKILVVRISEMVGEIREDSSRFCDAAEARDNMQQLVEAAFQETERVCAMMRRIAEQPPLYPETAAARGRDVISWGSRSGSADEGDPAGAFALLTPREREVLGHVSQGCSNKQGAVRMQIGSRTFESHRARLMRKLGARNAADLVRMAFLTRDVG